jgi:hypothetical protein
MCKLFPANKKARIFFNDVKLVARHRDSDEIVTIEIKL